MLNAHAVPEGETRTQACRTPTFSGLFPYEQTNLNDEVWKYTVLEAKTFAQIYFCD